MEGLECGVDNCIAYNIKDGIEGWEWDYEDDCCYNPLGKPFIVMQIT